VRSGMLSMQRLRQLELVMEGYIERGDVPGMSILIYRHGELYCFSKGRTAYGQPEPFGNDTIVRISSLSKPLAAAAAMILIEECRLRLDDPVDQWLPELSNRRVLVRPNAPLTETVPAKRSITVRDLLTFRMGYGYIWAPLEQYPILMCASQLGVGPNLFGQPPQDEWMRRLGTLPLMCQPGERWLYGFAFDVLGVLISRVSGQGLEAFLHERLFEPLGMSDTSFFVEASKRQRLSTCYWNEMDSDTSGSWIDWCKPPDRPTKVFDSSIESRWEVCPVFPCASSGLTSTASDYIAFGQMMLNRGRYRATRVLSRPSVELMTTDQLTPDQKSMSGFFDGYFASRGWGLGMSVTTARDHASRPVGKFGWDGGFGTSWYCDPYEDLTAVIFTQRCWTGPSPPPFIRDFWTLVYQAIDD